MNLDRQCSHATSDIGRWMECRGSLPVIIRPNLVFLKYLIVCQEMVLFVGILLFFFLFVFNFFFIVTFFLYGITFIIFFTLWLSHFTVLFGCCTFWSTHLEIKLLQPHGCNDSRACGHGTSKLLSCTLDLEFTSLCVSVPLALWNSPLPSYIHIPRA